MGQSIPEDFRANRCDAWLFFYLNEPYEDGVTNEARNVVDVESFHELCPVCFHSLDADFELLCDLLGRQALGNKAQHFALSWTQSGEQLSFCRSFANLEHRSS